MLSDLIRLSDTDIERVFQLCLAILVDEELATQATSMSVAALGLEADDERARLKRKLKTRFSLKADAQEIEINYQYLLQRIVLQKTKRLEKTQEEDGCLHENTWLLRYFKHIVSCSIGVEHAAVSGYCRVIHDYSRETAQRVHKFLVQRNPFEQKGLEEFSKWKTHIDDEVCRRFRQLLLVKKEKGNVLRFVQHPDLEEKKPYVIACLNLFKPWGMNCLLPANISEFSNIPAFKQHSNNPIHQQGVKDRRVATLLDYDCFNHLIAAFNGSDAREHLLIPHFALPTDSADRMIPPADLNNLPNLSPQTRDEIRRRVAEQSGRRQRLMARWLRIAIDGETVQDSVDLYSSRSIQLVLGRKVNTIEVWASDSDDLIPLAFKTLAWLQPSAPKAVLFTTRLEAGQKISLKIIYRITADNDIVPSVVRIGYQETNWSRALSFYVRRLGETVLPQLITPRFADALHAFLLEEARAINVALHAFVLLLIAIPLVFIGKYFLQPRPPENVASGPHPSAIYSPSPSISPSDEIASASPTIELPSGIPGGPSRPPNDNTILRTGRDAEQKSLALRRVRSVFIDPQSEDFKMLLRNSLILHLSKAGFVTNVQENDADARLSVEETRRGRVIVSLVSGRKQIWSHRFTVRERTSANAEELAAEVATRLEEARNAKAH